MAINKSKNMLVQITMPKEDYADLCKLNKCLNESGLKSTKSDILVQAFREYLHNILKAGQIIEETNKKKQKVTDPQGEKKDA